MKPMSMVGILLIVVGALVLAYQGFNYTQQKNVVDVGPIHATVDEQKHVAISPILGGLALLAGVGLLVAGANKEA
jgi:uncharacterized membrane protein